MKKTINIAKDFSLYPYGRSKKYSHTSGEKFREDLLLPAIEKFEEVTIELDGTEGYGSSFLDEAFAGLIRVSGFDKRVVLQKLRFVSEDDPSLIKEITDYIESA